MPQPQKKSQRTGSRQYTRQQLLEAAAEEFAQLGFQGANVNRIADAAGFSIGTIYNHFPSKRELMLAFIEEIGKMHVDFIQNQVEQETEPNLRLRTFFKAGFAFVHTNLVKARAIFNTLNGPDEEFRQSLFETYAPLFELLSENILKPGIENGDFRADMPPTTAGLIMLIYLGTGSQFSPGRKHWIDDEAVADFVLQALQLDTITENQAEAQR